MKPLWSVALIAKNEEKTLPRLLESLKEFREAGGEVVLVDTGSTDGTVDVARAYGCKVEEVGDRFRTTVSQQLADEINVRFVYEGEAPVIAAGDSLFDFSSARNHAASLASNYMISMPDCDEVFTKLDIAAINARIEAGVTQFSYDFVFSHDASGKPLRQFSHSKFYDRRIMKWVRIVHEVLSGSSQIEFLPPSVIKLEHFQNPETDRSGYVKGLALDCHLDPVSDRNSFYFARDLYGSGRLHSAIREFRRHIAMNGWDAERCQSHIYLGEIFDHLGDENSAVNEFFEAIKVDSGRREPWLALAKHYFAKNDPQRVACFANACLTIDQKGYYMDHADHYRNVPHDYLYWAEWYLGHKEEAKKHFEIARSFNPNDPRYEAEKVFFT